MHKLIIREGEVEQVREFESAELARLYRDYHLAFGQWNSVVKWVEENNITEEQRVFIVDEKTEIVGERVVRFYKISEGVKFILEEVDPTGIKQIWALIREKRNKLLHDTDWTQLPDTELTTDERKDYRGYRAYLRLFPKLHDDSSIVTASVYSFEDWKKGSR